MEVNGKILSVFLTIALVISLYGNYVQSQYNPNCDNQALLTENQRLFDTIDAQIEEINTLTLRLEMCSNDEIIVEPCTCPDSQKLVSFLRTELGSCQDSFYDLRNNLTNCQKENEGLKSELNETKEDLKFCQRDSGYDRIYIDREVIVEKEVIKEVIIEKPPCKKPVYKCGRIIRYDRC
jgi:hypothetical protein